MKNAVVHGCTHDRGQQAVRLGSRARGVTTEGSMPMPDCIGCAVGNRDISKGRIDVIAQMVSLQGFDAW